MLATGHGSLRQYSGVKNDLPKAMVLSATAGSIDRGACIKELRQYPGEVFTPDLHLIYTAHMKTH